MNTYDIRNMSVNQRIYWEVAGPFSIIVILIVVGVVYGPALRRKEFGRKSPVEGDDVEARKFTKGD